MDPFYLQLLNTTASVLFFGLGLIISAGRFSRRAAAKSLILCLSIFLALSGVAKFMYHSLPCLGNWCQSQGLSFYYGAGFILLGLVVTGSSFKMRDAWPSLWILMALSFLIEALLVLNQAAWLYLLQTGILASACLLALRLFFRFPGIDLRSRAGLILFLLLAGCAVLILSRIDRTSFRSELSDEYAALKIYQKIFYDMEDRGKAELKLLAVEPGIGELFAGYNKGTFLLRSRAKVLGASAIYCMNKSGWVIASSAPAFLGNYYGFRPYFRKAMKGQSNVFLGKGVTTGVEGIYFARPVIKDNRILGVLVMKLDIDRVLGADFKRSGILLMIKPGIILYGPDQFSGGLIGRMTPVVISHLNTEKILGTGHPRPLGLKEAGQGLFRFPDGGLYQLVSLPIYGQTVNVARFYPLARHLFFRFELALLFMIFGLVYFLLFMKFIYNRDFVSRLKREIGQRKKAEKELKVLAAAIEQAAEAVLITDSRGRIEYVNSAFMAVTGYRMEEVLGRTPAILNSGTHDQVFYRNLWKTILNGNVWRGRFTNRKKDGSLVQDETTIFPVKDEDGRISRFVAVKRDITREANLEAQLLHAQKMESVGILAGGIAHDFNNILAAIQVNLDLMRSKRGEPGLVARHLQKIQYGVSRASALVQQLLLFSRRETFRVTDIDLNESVSRMADMLRGMLADRVRLVMEMEDYLWRIRADSDAMDQVIMNLVVNASDAMPEGGILTIQTKNVFVDEPRDGLDSGHFVMLSISDTGTGMDPQTLQHIFDPFFTTKDVGTGTGLGLSVVYGIVKQFDGIIHVESGVGRGSTFHIYFPASLAAAFFLKKERNETVEKVETGQEILLIEDEDTIRSVIAEALEERNYKVVKARDDGDALALLADPRHHFGMVIMDMALASKGHRALWKGLKRDGRFLPVLLITGRAEYPDEPFGQEGGDFKVLRKPFRISELLASVKESLDRKCA